MDLPAEQKWPLPSPRLSIQTPPETRAALLRGESSYFANSPVNRGMTSVAREPTVPTRRFYLDADFFMKLGIDFL